MRVGGAFLILLGVRDGHRRWDHLVQWVQLRMVDYGETILVSDVDQRPVGRGELTARELGRWVWRQVTSMRTALVLLLLLALAAIPGSVIPQSGVDALEVTRWKEEHPKLTPIYEKLDLFSVFDSIWFSAIYLLLVLSLVGCIVPRCFVYAKALRAQPPQTPRNLSRLPDHGPTRPQRPADEVLARAREVLGKRYRLRAEVPGTGDAVSAERGYLRETGNLLFHLSVLVVLAGFGDRRALRIPGRRDPGPGLDLRQQPDPVRRLRSRRALHAGAARRLRLHRRQVRRRVAHQRSGRRHRPRVRGRPDLPRGRRCRRRPTTSRSTTRCRSATPTSSSSATATRR